MLGNYQLAFQASELRACTVCRLLVSCVGFGDLRSCFRVTVSVEVPFESIEYELECLREWDVGKRY